MSKSKKDNDAIVEILEYLQRQNRPYSVNDIATVLNTISKTVVQRSLDSLVESGDVREKVYNKQHVYVFEQTRLPSVPESVIQKLDAQIADLQKVVSEKTAQLRSHEAEFKKLSSLRTTEQLEVQLKELKEKNGEQRMRLEMIRAASSAKPISPEEFTAAEKEYDRVSGTYRKRARMLNSLVDAAIDAQPEKRNRREFMEEIGIDFPSLPPPSAD